MKQLAKMDKTELRQEAMTSRTTLVMSTTKLQVMTDKADAAITRAKLALAEWK